MYIRFIKPFPAKTPRACFLGAMNFSGVLCQKPTRVSDAEIHDIYSEEGRADTKAGIFQNCFIVVGIVYMKWTRAFFAPPKMDKIMCARTVTTRRKSTVMSSSSGTGREHRSTTAFPKLFLREPSWWQPRVSLSVFSFSQISGLSRSCVHMEELRELDSRGGWGLHSDVDARVDKCSQQAPARSTRSR